MALQQYAGPANWFITISVSDADMQLVLCLGDSSTLTYEEIQSVKFSLPTLRTRHRLLAANPYLAATSFQLAVRGFYKHLIGLPMVTGTRSSHPPVAARKFGIFGKVLAHGGAIEVQGRGTLHLHALLISPASAFLVQKSMDDKALWNSLRDHIDSIVKAHIDEYELSPTAYTTSEEEINQYLLKKQAVPVINSDAAGATSPIADCQYAIPEAMLRDKTKLNCAEPTSVVRDYRYSIPDEFLNDMGKINWLAARVASESNVHRHTTTCFKHDNGMCRMAFDRRQQAYQTTLLRLVARRNKQGDLEAVAVIPDANESAATDELEPSDEDLLYSYRASSKDIVVLELYRPPHSSIRDNAGLHTSADPDHPEYFVNIESKYPDAEAVPRLQARIVPYNVVLSASLRCNTSVEFLGSISQSTSAIFYLVKYLSKDTNKITNILPLARQAIINAEYGSKAADADVVGSGRDQKLLEQKLINLGNKSEYSAQMAALALTGFPSNVFSHEFVWLPIRELVAINLRMIEKMSVDETPATTDSTAATTDAATTDTGVATTATGVATTAIDVAFTTADVATTATGVVFTTTDVATTASASATALIDENVDVNVDDLYDCFIENDAAFEEEEGEEDVLGLHDRIICYN